MMWSNDVSKRTEDLPCRGGSQVRCDCALFKWTRHYLTDIIIQFTFQIKYITLRAQKSWRENWWYDWLSRWKCRMTNSCSLDPLLQDHHVRICAGFLMPIVPCDHVLTWRFFTCAHGGSSLTWLLCSPGGSAWRCAIWRWEWWGALASTSLTLWIIWLQHKYPAIDYVSQWGFVLQAVLDTVDDQYILHKLLCFHCSVWWD